MPQQIPNTPLRIPDLLLPQKHINLYKWAVIACDQFTSSYEYWKQVSEIVKDSPSMLHLILPEVYLEDTDLTTRLNAIKSYSTEYKQTQIFDSFEDCMLLIDRSSPRTHNRKGIMLQIDLSQYDPNPLKKTPIKSTEAIVQSRLPKRIAMRKHTCYDVSHVLMVYEDPQQTLITQLSSCITHTAYKTPLMMNGGYVHASFCDISKSSKIISNFFNEQSINTSDSAIFAVGDGNHSLMAAKQTWLDEGEQLDSPERWALVELVNIYDEGLQIKPIHRILFEANFDTFSKKLQDYGQMTSTIPDKYSASIISGDQTYYWVLQDESLLPIEILEKIIQGNQDLYKKLDYIHAKNEVIDLTHKHRGSIGIIIPFFDKSAIFSTVHKKVLFPRKSFSVGEGEDKKYYIETSLRE